MQKDDFLKDLTQIRVLMERSSKFISISGLSSIMIGVYALLGAALAYVLVYGFQSTAAYRDYYVSDPNILPKLVFIAVLVLIASLMTGLIMAKKKAHRLQQSLWNVSSKALLFAVAIPLITGGLLSLIFMYQGYYKLICSTLLIFYGLALVAGSNYTFTEIKWLGILEISLGLLALLHPGYGLYYWAIGFGVLHIIYGYIVYKKYE